MIIYLDVVTVIHIVGLKMNKFCNTCRNIKNFYDGVSYGSGEWMCRECYDDMVSSWIKNK